MRPQQPAPAYVYEREYANLMPNNPKHHNEHNRTIASDRTYAECSSPTRTDESSTSSPLHTNSTPAPSPIRTAITPSPIHVNQNLVNQNLVNQDVAREFQVIVNPTREPSARRKPYEEVRRKERKLSSGRNLSSAPICDGRVASVSPSERRLSSVPPPSERRLSSILPSERRVSSVPLVDNVKRSVHN